MAVKHTKRAVHKGKSSKRQVDYEWPQQVLEFEDLYRSVADVEELFTKETDRGCALIAGAALDEALAGLLSVYFINDKRIRENLLFDAGAPLKTFSGRIKLCRALRIISDDLYRDLEIVRDIRNKAAHFDARKSNHFRFSFSRQDIADKCQNIRNFPEEIRKNIVPRRIFEAFTGMTISCLTEYVGCSALRLSSEPDDYAVHRLYHELMLELVPKMKIAKYIERAFKKGWPYR